MISYAIFQMKGKREFPPNVVGHGDVLSHLSELFFIKAYGLLFPYDGNIVIANFYKVSHIWYISTASSCDVQYGDSSIHLTMVPNPSHLEV